MKAISFGCSVADICFEPLDTPDGRVHRLDVTGNFHELEHRRLEACILPDLRPQRLNGAVHVLHQQLNRQF